MRKIFFLIIVASLSLFSCSTVVYRPEVKGYIYDKQTKQPVVNAKIITGKGTVEAETDKQGFFRLTIEKRKKCFDFERGNDPMIFSFTISHPQYQSNTIEERTRGSFSSLKTYDSLYIEKK